MENKPCTIKAIKQILNVEVFSNEKDQQYIYKPVCHNPRIIVLCENIDYLTNQAVHGYTELSYGMPEVRMSQNLNLGWGLMRSNKLCLVND